MSMEIRIDRQSTIPIYLQICRTIKEMILSGFLPDGYKLPPERKLAEQLGVNRSTVLNAYRELKAGGLVDSHVGQGTVVAGFDAMDETEPAARGRTRLDAMDEGRTRLDDMDVTGHVPTSRSAIGSIDINGNRSSRSAIHGTDHTLGNRSEDTLEDTGEYTAADKIKHIAAKDIQGHTEVVWQRSGAEARRDYANRYNNIDTISSRASHSPSVPPMPWDQLFSESSLRIQDTTVRDLLKLSGKKDMILFAAGVTVPGIDSLDALQRIQEEVIKSYGHTAVQHMPADGFYPLRESISRLMNERAIIAAAHDVMILSGSQQGLDLTARAFIDPGDIVFVEEPTFFSAIHIFRAAGARVMGVPTDRNGMRTDILSMLLKRFKPKLIYTIPDFQNPSGAVMSMERRKELLSLAHTNQIIILEDDPYGMLRYEGRSLPALKAMDVYGNVLYLSTFSKLLFAGLRVGWISGPSQVLHRITLLKQMADLHASSLPQLIFDRYLREGLLESHMERTIRENCRRRDIMIEELAAAGLDGTIWNKPEGGLYIWCHLPDRMPQSRLLAYSAEKGVSFVPGSVFYPGNATGNYIRLNFTYPSPSQIKEGITKLADAYKDVWREMKNNSGDMHSDMGSLL